MRRIYTLLASVIAIGAFAAPTAGAHTFLVGASVSASTCTTMHTVKAYRSYASRVYRRDKVTSSAHRRLAAMHRCQRSFLQRKAVGRHHRRYIAERLARQRVLSWAGPRAPAYIALCESGGNPRAIGGGGLYRGKWQFDYGTWASVGGSGDPAAASEAEQDYRAGLLYQRRGTSPWPTCG